MSGAAAPARRPGSRRGGPAAGAGAWLLLPAAAFYLTFVVYPAGTAFVLSLYDWSGIGHERTFVGLANFREMLGSDEFWSALGHTVWFFVAIVVFQSTIGLFLALQLDVRTRALEIEAVDDLFHGLPDGVLHLLQVHTAHDVEGVLGHDLRTGALAPCERDRP